ncbi:MAG: class I SAM-dependent methyltransferase [Bacteroidota bacterium]
MNFINEAIDQYAAKYSQMPNLLLRQLRAETNAKTDLPVMLSSPTSGNFLRLLVMMTNPSLVVEIGTFTGFATLCMAEALGDNGRIMTCEINPSHIAIAKKYFQRSPFGNKIELREQAALETLRSIKEPVDFFFIDADKLNYINYYEEAMNLLKPGGIIVVDNCLWDGKVLNPKDEETKVIHALNQRIQEDNRVDHVILTVKDGLHWVRKK